MLVLYDYRWLTTFVPSPGLATGVLNLAIVVPQVRHFVWIFSFSMRRYWRYPNTIDCILFADSSLTRSRSMGCSLWGRKHPCIRLGIDLLPGSWCACSSQATKAIKLVPICRFPWIWLMLDALKTLKGCNIQIHTYTRLSPVSPFVYSEMILFPAATTE